MKIDRYSGEMGLPALKGSGIVRDFQIALAAQGKATAEQCQDWYDDVVDDAEATLLKVEDILSGLMPNTSQNRLEVFGELSTIQQNISNFIDECKDHLSEDQIRNLRELHGQIENAKNVLFLEDNTNALQIVFKVLSLLINTLRPRVPAF